MPARSSRTVSLSTPAREALLDALRDVLKGKGFRKRGAVFHRTCGDVVHLVGLQSSIDSAGQIPRVTLNLAVWCKRLADPGTEASVISAAWRWRLGDVMPGRADAWWLLPGKAAAPAVAKELAAALTAHGIPALDRVPDSAALLALCATRPVAGRPASPDALG